MSDDASSGRKRLVALLRLAAGLAILALVARTLPWSDRLEWLAGEAGEEELVGHLEGELVGDWKADSVGFRPEPEADVGEEWPAAVQGAARSGATLTVTRERDHELGGRFDWKPGMPRAFRTVGASWLLLSFAIFAFAACFPITRWWRLLALVGCRTSWWNALRLTLLGLFFNLVVPGLTGGDLFKAVIVARENPGRRADAVVSVVVDRLIGITVLAGLAASVILIWGDTFHELRAPLVLFLLAGLAAALAYGNRTLRRLVRFDALLAWLPLGDKLKSLDRAALVYGNHPGELAVAVALSLVNHVMVTCGCMALGHAVGVGFDQVSVAEWFVLVPTANIVSALPLAPGGWGLGEAAYKVLFEMIGANGALGVAVSVLFRLIQLSFGLVGGVFLLSLRGVELSTAGASDANGDAGAA